MARPKKTEVINVPLVPPKVIPPTVIPPILPITEHFGNGDLNILRDKINEIIGRV